LNQLSRLDRAFECTVRAFLCLPVAIRYISSRLLFLRMA
jgi:hypothetical protein